MFTYSFEFLLKAVAVPVNYSGRKVTRANSSTVQEFSCCEGFDM